MKNKLTGHLSLVCLGLCWVLCVMFVGCDGAEDSAPTVSAGEMSSEAGAELGGAGAELGGAGAELGGAGAELGGAGAELGGADTSGVTGGAASVEAARRAEERALLLEGCLSVLEVEHGSLCVLQPSALDPETLDAAPELPDQRGSGFGYHVVALPHSLERAQLWVHFGGTYGRPFDRSTGKIAAQAWLDELMASAYVVLQPAYDNKTSISFDCSEEPGKSRDNCAGEAREEVLTGQDLSPYREVDRANSVDYRLERLLAYIQASAPRWLPEGLDPEALSWPALSVSGHSQGGNLSYYIARRRGVRFACMFAAPFDAGDSVNPGRIPIADWFTEGESLTPVEQLAQLVATEDPFAMAFLGAGRLIGLEEGRQSFSVTRAPYHNIDGEEVDGHSAPLADPNLASDRARACLGQRE